MAISHLSSPLIEGLSAAQIILDLPSSIKELLENSLDSSATDIIISFWDQGYHSFQLQDNGHGMAMDDLRKCGLRNHTSKIEHYSQVIQNTSETFGFRGEALYGLSKLSESVVITTKREAATAMLTISNYGKERSLSALEANQQPSPLRHSESGTILRVTSFLSGLSVRRKDFLRTKALQFTKTIELISQYSISNPSVSFTVRHFSGFNDSCSCNDDDAAAGAGTCDDDRCCIIEKKSKNTSKSTTTILSLPKCATNDVWKRYQMLKKERMTCHTFTSLNDPSHNREEDPFTYKCFWTFSGSSVRQGGSFSYKTSSKRPSIFLNQKPIVNPKITKTLSRMAQENGLGGLFFILLIESSTKKDVLVDFNIKKDKSVMRSSFDQCLLDSLCRSFSSSISEECNLGERRVLPAVDNANKAASGISGGLASVICTEETMSISDKTKTLKEKTPQTTTTTTPTTTIPSPLAREVFLKKDDFIRMKVIGQFNHGFILTFLEESTYIIDQHASDERRRLEELENALSFRVQRLIEPIPIDEWMLGRTDFLQSNGFVIEGSSLVGLPLIDGINLLLTKDDMMELVERERECGSDAMVGGGNTRLWELQSVHCRLASKACRSAIMIGDHLSPKEQEQVVRGLSGLRKPWICAHGRPTIRLLD